MKAGKRGQILAEGKATKAAAGNNRLTGLALFSYIPIQRAALLGTIARWHYLLESTEETVMRNATLFFTNFVVAFACLATHIAIANAATIYRCAGSDGVIAFQDHPCRVAGTQRVLDIVSNDPTVPAVAESTERVERPTRPRAMGASRRRAVEPTSFECRTNTGMVFYRHSRCPASLVDGTDGNGGSRRVMVTSQGMERREACRRMRNGARDGNQFDDRVSTYERNLGRDTCRNY